MAARRRRLRRHGTSPPNSAGSRAGWTTRPPTGTAPSWSPSGLPLHLPRRPVAQAAGDDEGRQEVPRRPAALHRPGRPGQAHRPGGPRPGRAARRLRRSGRVAPTGSHFTRFALCSWALRTVPGRSPNGGRGRYRSVGSGAGVPLPAPIACTRRSGTGCSTQWGLRCRRPTSRGRTGRRLVAGRATPGRGTRVRTMGSPAGPAPVHPPPGFAGPSGPAAPHPPGHAPAPQHHVAPQHAPAPMPDTTGHVQLPPGGPVAMPSPPPAAGAPDPTSTTLAVLLIGPAGAGQDERRPVLGGPPPGAHRAHQPGRRTGMGALGLRRPAVGLERPLRGAVPPRPPHLRLRRAQLPGQRHLLHPGRRRLPRPAGRRARRLEAARRARACCPSCCCPGLEIVLERNAERSGNRRLTDEEVARIHGRMAGWYGSGLPIIDNSQLDVPTTARVLDDVLARSSPARRSGERGGFLSPAPPLPGCINSRLRRVSATSRPRTRSRQRTDPPNRRGIPTRPIRTGTIRPPLVGSDHVRGVCGPPRTAAGALCGRAAALTALVSRPANVRYLAGAAPRGAVLLLGRRGRTCWCARPGPGPTAARIRPTSRPDEALRVQYLPGTGGDPAVAAADLAAGGRRVPRRRGAPPDRRPAPGDRARSRPGCASPTSGCAVEQLRVDQGRGGDLLPAHRAPRSPTRRWASCWSRSSSAAPSAISPWSWSAASSTTAPTARPSRPPSPPARTPGRRGHRPTDRRVEEGDFLSVCLGADYRGYRCEIGRTFVIGTSPGRLADRAVRPRLRRPAGRPGGARARRRVP